MPAFAVGVALLLALVVIAFAARVAAVAVLGRRHPAAAELVARHWTWLPVLVMAAYVAVAAWPVGALLAAAAIGIVVAWPEMFGLPTR
ncbi:MAG TPA: hypothetical protein VFI47_05315 [Acidimicrobiales bacterium]|nr:hypothetical protein [Acidimicrobiales bacterium]